MNSLVIGSGFGGIAAALRLRAKNHKVTLIEKHSDLGGRARVFKKNGFIFEDGKEFDYSGNEELMKNQINKISEKDVRGYENLVSFTEKIFDKGFTELSDIPFDKFKIILFIFFE